MKKARPKNNGYIMCSALGGELKIWMSENQEWRMRELADERVIIQEDGMEMIIHRDVFREYFDVIQ